MSKIKILVVEDEIDVQLNIKTILLEEGYNVITASDGNTGVQLARNEKPDLILCDIAMPGVDGYGVIDKLAVNKCTQSIPFIFLTAKVEKEDIRKGMQLGADDYLFKPFKIDDLLTAIKARLKRFEILKSDAVINDENINKSKYNYDDKIFVQEKNKPQLIAIKEIVHINSENQYTLLNMFDKKSFLIRKSISEWESLLPEKKFLRIHRSTIINSEYIIRIEKWFNSTFQIYVKDIQKPFISSKRFSAIIRKNKME